MRLFTIVLGVLFAFTCYSQNNRLETGLGVSLTSFTIKNGLKLKSDVETSSTPTYAISYHRHLKKGVWFGGEYTSQSIDGSYSFSQEVAGVSIKDTLSFNYLRRGYMASIFYVLPFENEKIEFGVGLRAGIRKSAISGASANENVNELLNLATVFGGVRPRASIPIIIGYYPIKKVGFIGTLNIGPTYLAKVGLSIKL